MTKLEMPRTVRDRLRKRFPRDAPDVTKLGYPALASWLNESHFQRTLFPLWTPQGFRWRRASMRAMTEYSDRLLAHKGGVPGLCDHCQLRPATSHVAYQPQEDPRFGHYCDACSPSMPVGWLAVQEFNRKPAVPDKQAS